MDEYKIVCFGDYCKTCEHFAKEENEYPCRDCLDNPARIDSRIPVHYEKKKETVTEKKRKKSQK